MLVAPLRLVIETESSIGCNFNQFPREGSNEMDDKDKTTVAVVIGALAVILIVIDFLIRNQTTQPVELVHSAIFLVCLTVAMFSFRYAVRKWRKRIAGL
jgi:hypothetical protein